MAIVQEWISRESRVSWIPPQGVSVAYISWDTPLEDEAFCIKLLKEEGVLLVSGSRFDLSGGVRLDYCTSEDTLREGLAHLSNALRQL